MDVPVCEPYKIRIGVLVAVVAAFVMMLMVVAAAVGV